MYLTELMSVGGIVNKIASARGIIKKRDSRMLAENGRHVKGLGLLLTQSAKRKGNTKMKVSIENFEELKINFIQHCKIPPSLIINWIMQD